MKRFQSLVFCHFVIAALFFFPQSFARMRNARRPAHTLVYVGTYGANAKGIYAFRFGEDLEMPTSLGLAAEIANPFFLTASRDGRFLYSTNMGKQFRGQVGGSVSAYAIDAKSGMLTSLNQVSSRGADAAYISLDRTGKFALIANYTGGSVAVIPLHPDGSLGEVTGFDQHGGAGADPKRQGASHPHSIGASPDNRCVLSADLGLDKLFVYRLDASAGSLSPAEPPFAPVTATSGPRHFVFSPNGRFVYTNGEMGSNITVFSYSAATCHLQSLQVISSLPKDFSGDNTGAEIQIDAAGKFLYASNRGNDTIAVFAIDARDGKITPVEYAPARGKTPGMFAIDPTGTHLFVANKGSDSVTIFRIDKATGRLTPVGDPIHVPDPVCFAFVPVD